jgi:hypothetical protein
MLAEHALYIVQARSEIIVATVYSVWGPTTLFFLFFSQKKLHRPDLNGLTRLCLARGLELDHSPDIPDLFYDVPKTWHCGMENGPMPRGISLSQPVHQRWMESIVWPVLNQPPSVHD